MEATMQEAVLKGETGKLYRFAVLRADGPFPHGPAVYAFAKPGFGGRGWTPLFLSRTANVAQRVPGHERWAEAEALGATHVLVLSFPERAQRELAEDDLLMALRPVLNTQMEATQDEDRRSAEVVFFPPIRIETQTGPLTVQVGGRRDHA
jgi:hypothetical protein